MGEARETGNWCGNKGRQGRAICGCSIRPLLPTAFINKEYSLAGVISRPWLANNLMNVLFFKTSIFRLILYSLKHLTNKGANNGI